MTTALASLTEADRQAWSNLVKQGIARSIAGLSEMVGDEVKIFKPIDPVPISVKGALNLVGGPEVIRVAADLCVKGDAPGHMLVIFNPESAYALVDMLLGQSQGTTQALGDMEQSAVSETGNVMGSRFLSALGDATGVQVMPLPPAVMMDMAGSMLDTALSEILTESDEMLAVDTVFGTGDRRINGTFLVMPSHRMVRKLLEKGCAA